MRLRVLQELDDSGLDEGQTRQVPSINLFKLDRSLEVILCRGGHLIVEIISGSLKTFVLNLPPQRAAFKEVLMDAKVGANATTAELYDEFKLQQLLYQIETSFLVVACLPAKVHGADAVFATSSDELECSINHWC